jgi:hypothetical protein
MWWIRAGTVPEPTEAITRLEALGRLGPSAFAFTFRSLFAAPVEVDTI